MPVSRKRRPAKSRTATHRPATRRRRFRHDDLTAVDLFKVWGSAKAQVDGYGNAVSAPAGMWIARRMRAVLHPREAIL